MKVDKRGPVARPDLGPCWQWTASVTRMGYGQLDATDGGKKRMISAHRFSWELHNGAIPEGDGHQGTCVLHRCDNPRCVRPDHLFLGTQSENITDMWSKGRHPQTAHKQNGDFAARATEAVMRLFADPVRKAMGR